MKTDMWIATWLIIGNVWIVAGHMVVGLIWLAIAAFVLAHKENPYA